MQDQSNPAPPQHSAPPASDNTAIMTQLTQLTEMMTAMRSEMNSFTLRMEALKARYRPLATQHSTPPAPPAPQEAQKEEEKEKEQPLHQATVEDIAETTTESTTKDDSTSTLSTISRLRTAPASRDPAACLSNALLFAFQHATILALMLNTLPGYIGHSEGMEATGQG